MRSDTEIRDRKIKTRTLETEGCGTRYRNCEARPVHPENQRPSASNKKSR